ncbi:RIB43A-like with coiled-coils protein 2 [Mizuhopecten yessoensis]|uniref:RIB43A-like with coiled-coils protein 2 n=1 Tax=Mizuhopecten yessoensis TaxID=6573 RepID=A0A210PH40_MIZYE|nr:RIB43A-like with coiled-coils protein 2 [Mizuhopecten yessoensis]OWF35801.1 RIB43A-like with coiled-coils protein 2 [Mizuhopecten yessoensis]
MYKLDLPIDYKEAAAIERRKLMEEQRKSRIFNSKTRTIGIDAQAIEQQNLDKKQQEEYERSRDRSFAADAVRNDKISMMLEQRQNHDVRELNKAVNDFRSMHQQPGSRREFDLYDPDYLKKDKPARVSDDDPRCGISSLQKFEGEDLNNKARLNYQQEQLREWSTQQSQEKDQAKRNMDQANRLYELKMRELDQRAMDLANSEEECRRAINMAVKDYNQALDRERSEKERLQKQQNHDDNMTEIANHIFGDVLTENPSVAQSAFGPHRVITDRWKGMSPQQLDHIRNLQELQRAEKNRHDQEEELRNKEWERQQVANARAAMLLEREMDRKRRELDREQADENRRLASEQTSHKDFLNKEVYTNPPTAAYFTQFNTTTR